VKGGALCTEYSPHPFQYTNFIQTMQDLTEIRVTTLRKTMQGLAEGISAQAKAEDAEFPFVTLPSFEVPAGHARKVSGVVSILYAPLVQDEQAWLDYARAHTAWVNMSRAIVSAESSNTEKHGHSHGESGHSTHPDDSHADHGEDIQQHEENHFMMEPIHAIEPGIRGDYVIVPFSGQNPDFPLWQSSPPPDHLRRFFNLNLQSLPVTASIIKKLMELKGKTCHQEITFFVLTLSPKSPYLRLSKTLKKIPSTRTFSSKTFTVDITMPLSTSKTTALPNIFTRR